MKKVCLVCVFNHRFENNIVKLKKIYGNRFSLMRFLVPFYRGEENEEIIPVYESSYYFGGFFIQALEKLMALDADYYLFAADDLILNPQINEENFRDFFGLNDTKKCYIDYIQMLNSAGGISWHHSRPSSLPFFSKGLLWRRELPPYSEAMSRFETFFGEPYKEKYDEKFFLCGDDINEINTLVQNFYDNNGHSFDIPYPMAKAYSDILILRKDSMCDFSKLCGIFSAMNVFVEIAIPTSLVLLFDREEISCLSDTIYSSKLVWHEPVFFKELNDKYQHKFSAVYENWDERTLYVHPVKLSEWIV